ncbi:MAG: thioredoxin fold domain-containing protein [Candidatus Cloacimonetes bacterium]|nr:thioredoxin fold domain-containing protein [Candidatus Cloacimonadota bacterium]
MNSVYKLILAFLMFGSLVVANQQWQTSDFQKIDNKEKPILYFFHAPWCSWCHKLKDEVFSLGEVEDLLSQFHLVSVNGDDKGEGTKLKKALKVSVFPTIVYRNSVGELIDFATGYKKVQPMVDELSANLSGVHVFDRLQEDLDKTSDSSDQLALYMDLIDKKSNMGYVKEALDLLNSIQPKFDFRDGSFDLRVMKGTLYYKLKDYRKAILYMRVAIQSAKTESEYRACTRTLIRAYNKIGKKHKRFEIYQTGIDLYPSIKTYNSFAWDASKKKKHLDKALRYINLAIDLLDKENNSLEDNKLSEKKKKRKADILDTLAEVYYARKEYSNAFEVSQQIFKLHPNSKSYNKKRLKYKKKL